MLLVVTHLKGLYISVQEGAIAFEGIFKYIYKKMFCEYQWMKTYLQ